MTDIALIEAAAARMAGHVRRSVGHWKSPAPCAIVMLGSFQAGQPGGQFR